LEIMGKPTLVEKGLLHYAMKGHKYPLAVNFKNGKLAYINYENIGPKIKYDSLKGILKGGPLKDPIKKGHDRGRYLTYKDQSGIVLTFRANSMKLKSAKWGVK
jgi:hypothetical protein